MNYYQGILGTLISGQPFDPDYHFSSRIVGGTEIEIEEVPWQVSLQSCFSTDDNGRCFHNCGGFIISEKWIMTAGHCVMTSKMKARIGTKNNMQGGSMVDIKQMIRHEKYNSRTIDFDYALFELNEPLHFTDKVEAIALPSENEVLLDGTLCKLAGWGATFNSSQPTTLLRQLTHPIMNQKECANDVQSVVKLTPRMLCAGPKGDGKSGKYSILFQKKNVLINFVNVFMINKIGCFGDSGSALTCISDGTRKVFGIASWVTAGCLGPRNRTVYARVQAARRWIKSVTGI